MSIDVNLLKSLLAVPTASWREHAMVDWLVHYAVHHLNASVTVDAHRNVYITKGVADYYPCVAAHIDTVHALHEVRVVEDQGNLIGFDQEGHQTGIGADDKAGVFICLNLLQRFNPIRAILFATEEVGCIGALRADARFFNNLAYLAEFDCPSHHMLSYTCSGVRLFANQGDFIQSAMPVLRKHGSLLWQHHPYTDVMAVRNRFPLSCLNLSCGYHRWHCRDEFVCLPDLELALHQGEDLVRTLEHRRFDCPLLMEDRDEPLVSIGPLEVPLPTNHAELTQSLEPFAA